MEHPTKMDENRGTPILGNLQMGLELLQLRLYIMK